MFVVITTWCWPGDGDLAFRAVNDNRCPAKYQVNIRFISKHLLEQLLLLRLRNSVNCKVLRRM